jgi:thiol:disulfide interchange protein
MKKIVHLLFLGLLFLQHSSLFAQDSASNIIQWEFSGSGKPGGIYKLSFKGKIQGGWKLFSTTMKDDLPNTRIVLDSGSMARIIGISESGELQTKKDPLFDNSEIKYFENEVEMLADVRAENFRQDIKGTINFMAIRGNQVIGPESISFRYSFDPKGNLIVRAAGLRESAAASQELKRISIDLLHPLNSCGGTGFENSRSKNLWNIFILGFLGGLVALFTPCVFPMIPLTVSFFTKKSKENKKGIFHALVYGLFILLIYLLLSLPFYFLDSVNPEILNNISTNVWLNIIFFVIFIVFALSFFGLFEITLPSSIANSAGAKSGVGGLIGIFFMALTLALVSFSCTGPILGSLLAGSLSTNGGAIQLTVGMGGFGLALALPFALFALFPGWLNSLPKSGGWLNTVKIVLGFLELALALKFLSNADLVEHWGILKREIFIGIWIIIGIGLVLYLWGILAFRHDPPPKKLSRTRIAIGLIFLLFVIYLLPGITNTSYANRSLISGFPPPFNYSVYGSGSAKGKGVEADIINDYERALKMAKEKHKPLLIDFTGWACVNCRKMEENVWPQPGVKDLIQNKFILVSLYVDDRKPLPDSEQFLFPTSEGNKKPIKTVGDKFATLQSENFINSSQPLYVILSPDEKLMNYPVGYTPDPSVYSAWLRCGLEAYHKLSGSLK